MGAWTVTSSSGVLLEERGGPFETSAFRAAMCASQGRWRDVSVDAVGGDGAIASVALVRAGARAQSMPYGYGGIRTAVPLARNEEQALLDAVRLFLRVPEVVVRSLDACTGDVSTVTTSVVDLRSGDPREHFASKARQSIRRATRAGVIVAETGHSSDFRRLYATASEAWGMRYPDALIKSISALGAATCFEGRVDDDVVSSALVLQGADHWMYWLGAQSALGRQLEASYLVVASILEAAWIRDVAFVNLGANMSAGSRLEGVERFKRRLGAQQVGIVTQTSHSVTGRAIAAARSVIGRAVRSVRR